MMQFAILEPDERNMIISDKDKMDKAPMDIKLAKKVELKLPMSLTAIDEAPMIVDELQAAKKRGENVYYEEGGFRFFSEKDESRYEDTPSVRFYSAIVTQEGAVKAMSEYQNKIEEAMEDIKCAEKVSKWFEKFDKETDDGRTM